MKIGLSRILWGGAGLALAAGLIWLMWPRPKTVDTTVIDRGAVVHSLSDEGRTRIHDVFVIATPVAGDLQRITVEPGDRVRRGDIVAVLKPVTPALLDARTAGQTQAAVAAAEAAVRAAEASLALARRDQARTVTLFAKGYAAQAAVDTAKATVDAAVAAHAARLADLRQARMAASTPGQSAAGTVDVRSPASGRVLQLFQQSEAVTAAGAPLLNVGDPAGVEIIAEFLSQDAVKMHPGDAAYVENGGGTRPLPAVVTRVEPNAHTKVSALGVEEQRVNVIARLTDLADAPPLGHGFRVDLKVVVANQANAVRIPVDALVRTGSGWSVFRVTDGRAHLTPVSVGDAGDGYRAVSGGVAAGDRVVLFPGDTLRDGDAVKVR